MCIRDREFPLSEADGFDVPASFARAIEGPGDVAYLCNPNNPTGRLVDPRVIDAAAVSYTHLDVYKRQTYE